MSAYEFSEMTTGQLISAYTNLGSAGSDFKDALAAEIFQRLAELDDEQFWLFVVRNEQVAAILDRIGHSRDFSIGYTRRKRGMFLKLLKEAANACPSGRNLRP